MKKIFLLIPLIAGCVASSPEVSKKSDASIKINHSINDGSITAQNMCNSWCHHLASNKDADTECINQCQDQYSECNEQ